MNDENLFCIICNKNICSNQKSDVKQHFLTKKHKKNENSPKNTNFENFDLDLCELFLSNNIPLNKINNPSFKIFFRKYFNKEIPDESTLRKNYVDKVYLETISKIKEYIGESKIWISIDETTDSCGRSVVNFIIGPLDPSFKKQKCFLLNVSEIEKVNSIQMMNFFLDSISLIYSQSIFYTENLLLLVTDNASYMRKFGKNLKCLSKKIVHLSCLVHFLHRISENIRSNFPDIDSLVSCIKKIFKKCPSKKNKLKKKFPEMPLPPDPVITRWGTWLKSVVYISTYFDQLKTLIFSFEENLQVTKVKSIFEKSNVINDLVYIVTNFSFLIDIFILLQRKTPLSSSFKIFSETLEKLSFYPFLSRKIETLKKDNIGFNFMNEIYNMDQKKFIEDSILKNYSPLELSCFNSAPITSCDVERTFSKYKNLLSDNRKKLKIENIKKYLIVYCNNFDE